MTISPFLTHVGTATMIAVSVVYAARLGFGALRQTPTSWDTEFVHFTMAMAMAGMLDARLDVVPAVVWLTFFAVAGSWFALRSLLSARRHLSGSLVGGTLVHVGGCAAMVYMFVVVPPAGSMANMADLICGARMIGMTTTGSSGLVNPWTGPALALAVVLLVGAALLAMPRFRVIDHGMQADRTTTTRAGILAPLRSSRTVLVAQMSMCLVMTATLVALYR